MSVFSQGIISPFEEWPAVYEMHPKGRGFHPVRVGDVYSHYKIIRKLGYGAYSTVWLAEEIQFLLINILANF